LPAVRQLRLQETLAQFAAPLQEQVSLHQATNFCLTSSL